MGCDWGYFIGSFNILNPQLPEKRLSPMKLAITSDVHLGDPNCVLVKDDLTFGSKFEEFADTIGKKNDYLILLGDIFDFSISSYQKVYDIAKIFLGEVQRLEIARQIVYVPGNHDFEFWHILEHEVNVIKKIKDPDTEKKPREFRWSVPGVFDDRKEQEEEKFVLPDVTPNLENPMEKYGDIFLSYITTPSFIFNVAYPNVYIITRNGECVLLTHGQYFEPFWALTGEWALKIAQNDITIGDPKREQLNLKELAAFNFPLNQLASSGVGQAGALTNDVIRPIQREVKDKEYERVKRYINRFDDHVLDKAFDYCKFDPREWFTDFMIWVCKCKLKKYLKKYKPARYDEDFMNKDKPAFKKRFTDFYHASLGEIDRLKNLADDRAVDIPQSPSRIIFGHTHQPISWDDSHLDHEIDGYTVYLHNTGGWLTRKMQKSKDEFRGASIFFYETDRGLYSKSIN